MNLDQIFKNIQKITKIFNPFFKSKIFGVKMKNLKKSVISHLIMGERERQRDRDRERDRERERICTK